MGGTRKGRGRVNLQDAFQRESLDSVHIGTRQRGLYEPQQSVGVVKKVL